MLGGTTTDFECVTDRPVEQRISRGEEDIIESTEDIARTGRRGECIVYTDRGLDRWTDGIFACYAACCVLRVALRVAELPLQ